MKKMVSDKARSLVLFSFQFTPVSLFDIVTSMYMPMTSSFTKIWQWVFLSQFTDCFPVLSFCLDQETLGRIQRVQNCCIRFIYGIRKYDHVSHKLVEMSWLPMKICFEFHALCIFHTIILMRSSPYLFFELV